MRFQKILHGGYLFYHETAAVSADDGVAYSDGIVNVGNAVLRDQHRHFLVRFRPDTLLKTSLRSLFIRRILCARTVQSGEFIRKGRAVFLVFERDLHCVRAVVWANATVTVFGHVDAYAVVVHSGDNACYDITFFTDIALDDDTVAYVPVFCLLSPCGDHDLVVVLGETSRFQADIIRERIIGVGKDSRTLVAAFYFHIIPHCARQKNLFHFGELTDFLAEFFPVHSVHHNDVYVGSFHSQNAYQSVIAALEKVKEVHAEHDGNSCGDYTDTRTDIRAKIVSYSLEGKSDIDAVFHFFKRKYIFPEMMSLYALAKCHDGRELFHPCRP